MTILVTGASGFLGKRVCKLLDVRGLSYSATSRSISGKDLRSQTDARDVFLAFHPTYVIHCASLGGGIQTNYDNPVGIFRDNLSMTMNVLDMASRTGVKRLVQPIANCAYPASASVFREAEFWDGPMHESVLVTGFTRKAAVVGAWAYKKQAGLDTLSLVLPNCYGIDDHLDPVRSHALGALVVKAIEAKAKGSEYLTVWGTGTPVREWLYADDAAEALIRGLTCPPHEGVVNVGVERGISVRELAELIAREAGFTGQLRFDASKPDGAAHKTLDCAIGRKLLGWSPQVDLHEGIRRTVSWVQYHLGVQ
jgi:GDP-L-fucose synthase